LSAVSLVLLAVSVPLARSTIRSVQTAQRTSQATQTVATWLVGSDLDLVDVSLSGHHAVVDVAGAGEPPSTQTLADALVGVLGEQADVTVRWSQRSERRNGPPPPPDEHQRLVDQAHPLVRAWLEANTDRANEFEILALALTDKTFQVDLAGPVRPPAAATLADALSAGLGRSVSVDIRWSERLAFKGEPGVPVTVADDNSRIREAVERWAEAQGGLVVQRLDIDSRARPPRITVDVAGEQPPSTSAPLEGDLARLMGEAVALEVWFTLRTPVASAPTTTTTGTTVASSSASTAPTTAAPPAATTTR
jgi:hypothetical protein